MKNHSLFVRNDINALYALSKFVLTMMTLEGCYCLILYLNNLKEPPCGSAGKESAYKAEDLGSIPRLEDPLEKGKAPLQYSGLENSMGSPWGRKESDRNEQLSLSK